MNEQSKKVITKNLTYTIVPRQDGNISSSYTKDETDAKFNEASKKLTEANEKLVDTKVFFSSPWLNMASQLQQIGKPHAPPFLTCAPA